ncbi:MAG: hypothetical protein ABR512_05430 [Desulfopila sp.]
MTFPTINRWENNRAKPSPLALEKIESLLRSLGDKGEAPHKVYFGVAPEEEDEDFDFEEVLREILLPKLMNGEVAA